MSGKNVDTDGETNMRTSAACLDGVDATSSVSI